MYVHRFSSVSWVPDQPKTPHRSVRVPDELWEAAKWVAESRGERIAEVVRRALREYVDSFPGARRRTGGTEHDHKS